MNNEKQILRKCDLCKNKMFLTTFRNFNLWVCSCCNFARRERTQQTRAQQVAKEIISYSQNNATEKSIKFALEEIEKYFIEKDVLKLIMETPQENEV